MDFTIVLMLTSILNICRIFSPHILVYIVNNTDIEEITITTPRKIVTIRKSHSKRLKSTAKIMPKLKSKSNG